MKRVMTWMYEHYIQEVDEKGKPLKRTEWRLEPFEGSKRVRVALYRPTKAND